MSAANFITFFRILLVPFFITALLSYTEGYEIYRQVAFWIFFAASISDALDGLVARVMKKQTKLGQFLDPLADKLLLLSGYLGILFVHALPYHPPLWITVTIVFRDFFVIGAMIILYLFSGSLKIEPHFIGKCTTAAQMATLIAILLKSNFSPLLWNVTAFLTIVSGAIYIFRDFKLLKPNL